MGGYGTNAVVFLVQTLFGLYILCIMLRLILQMTRANFYNPVSQFLVKVTNPPLVPMRRFIPGFMGIDMAAVALMVVLQSLELFIIAATQSISIGLIGLLVLTIAELLRLLVNVYFYAILIQVILSWVAPGGANPAVTLIYSITEPLLGRARRLIPPISGFDLSPIVVMIGLQLATMLFISPIADLGRGLA
jgi:YggT family protein